MAPPPLPCAASSASGGVAIEQLDRHPLRRAQEGDAHARPHRGRLPGELAALGLELRDHGVDAGDRESEVIEALVGRDRRRIDAIAGRDRRDEDVGAAELEVDARLALLHAADHLGAEHAFVPLGGPFRVGGAQMDVIPGVLGHGLLSVGCRFEPSLARMERKRNWASETLSSLRFPASIPFVTTFWSLAALEMLLRFDVARGPHQNESWLI